MHDEGDLPLQIWRPDRVNPRAQNVGQVTESIQELIERLIPLLARGDKLLVLGGNCTVALGVVAALVASRQILLECCMWIETMTSTRPRARPMERLTGWEWPTHSPFPDPSMCLSMCSALTSP